MDEYQTIVGYHAPGVITGKPIPLGGSEGRSAATARGGMYVIREAARALDINLRGATAAIQGYGNAGQHAHQLLANELGLKVVAVSDSKGGIFCADGLDPAATVAHKNATGSVSDQAGTRNISNEQLLTLDVDVRVPAALENAITKQNAADVKARIVAELANGPTTPDADDILFAKGAYLIPDFLCNAGGVTVSYFEQVQNAYNYYWPLRDVYAQLENKMVAAFRAVHETARRYGVNNRVAAYLISVQRVAEAVRLRGWV